jgi:hypothetical protein
MYGQRLYQNVMVHDAVSGSMTITRKDEIEVQIEEQLCKGGADLLDKDAYLMEQLCKGGEGLLNKDAYLMEINLGDLPEPAGDRHAYWVLAIKAARIAGQLVQVLHWTDDDNDYG